MKTVKVTFNTGDTLTTAINGTDEEIRAYYQTGRQFNLGDGAGGDRMARVVLCEFIPCPACSEIREITGDGVCERCADATRWAERNAIACQAAGIAPAIAPAAAPRGHKVIRFYRYNGREIVHTSSWADFELILALTGQRFINSAMREMFRDLSGGAITWEEVKP